MDVEALHGTELKRGEDSSRVRTDSGEIAEISQLGLAQRGFRSISMLNAESLVSEREKREKEEKRATMIGNEIMSAGDIIPEIHVEMIKHTFSSSQSSSLFKIPRPHQAVKSNPDRNNNVQNPRHLRRHGQSRRLTG